MQPEGFRVTATYEADHWWFRSRRELIRLQVARAARALGFPARRLRLLDFGCGTGFNLTWLSEFGEVVGADRVTGTDPTWRRTDGFAVLEVDALASETGRFDLVTALDVLEHLDDDVDGLRTLRALLAPGGQLVLTVPAYAWLWSGEDEISEHRRRYTRAALVRRCRQAGLRVEYASYFNLAILPAMGSVVWARRLLSRSEAPQTNLWMPRPWLNQALYALTAREAAWVGDERVALPAGTSIVCRARREA